MTDEYLFLFAQWGVFNTEQCRYLLNKFGSFKSAWKNIKLSDLQDFGMRYEKVVRIFEIKNRFSFKNIIDLIQDFKVSIYYVDDDNYPEPLKQIGNPPPFLFVRGQLPSFHKSLAVVGTRKVSQYGRITTERFTADLVRNGFVIVSGLAMGVDSIAHKTTIAHHGITVAVLASGVDVISPATNYRLAQNILHSGGAIVSTYPLGTRAQRHHFPARNVVIACLCQGTLVTEGGCHSGALITAKESYEHGREVFAVPNNINHYALSGTNDYIRNSKAKLVENIDHILEDLQMEFQIMRQEIDFSHDERMIMEALSIGPKSMDDLILETRFDIPELSALILQLQLKKAVIDQNSKWMIT